VDLSEFLTTDIRQLNTDSEETLKTTEEGQITLAKEKCQKIFNLAHWLQAWAKYTKAALIICASRIDELVHHQEAIIGHCTVFPFETVYNWDRARKFFITKARDQTLLIPNYDIDTKYLIYGNPNKQQTSSGRNNRAGRSNASNTCRLFNWAFKCSFGETCNYKHKCNTCRGSHSAKICSDRGKRQRRNREESEPTTSGKKSRIKKEDEN